MSTEDTTARWDGERTQDAENAAAERRDHEAEQRREMEARLARLQQRVAAEEERQAAAQEDDAAEDCWVIEPDGEGVPALWAPYPGGNAPGRTLAWSRDRANAPDPWWPSHRPAAPVWEALEHLQQLGLLHRVMERHQWVDADLRAEYDRLCRRNTQLEREQLALKAQRKELGQQVEQEQHAHAETQRRLSLVRADRDGLQRQLDRAADGALTQALPQVSTTQEMRPGPGPEDARGPGQTVPPDAEPQQAEQGCQDCALLQQEAQRLRQIHSALRDQRDQAQGTADALRRHLDDALYLLDQVRDERDEALRQRDMAHLRVADEADGDAQVQELTDDRPPMDLRSAMLNAAIFAALVAAAIAVGL